MYHFKLRLPCGKDLVINPKLYVLLALTLDLGLKA